MLKKAWLCIAFAMSGVCCSAQQSANAAGGEASGTSGTLSYTVGQVDYIGPSSSTGSVYLGVQQPYDVIADEKDFQILVFPNPTPGAVTIRILNPQTSDLHCYLIDMLGRILVDRVMAAGETTIPLSDYSAAAYILQVRIGEEVKTYKIIKTNNP